MKAFPHSRAIPTGDSAVDVDIRLAVYAAAFVAARFELKHISTSGRHLVAMQIAQEAVEANRRARDK